MSDCRHGGRDVYEPARRVDISIHFTDPAELEYQLPLDLRDREVDHFEVGGVRYDREEFDLKELYRDSERWAIEMDGTLFIRADIARKRDEDFLYLTD